MKNGWMYVAPAVLNCVFVLLSVYTWFSRYECMWLYPHLGPRAASARTWLMICVLQCQWKSFKLKQNGVQNVWLNQTCSAQCEVNEMWQTLLIWLRPRDLFHNKVSARLCQCTQLLSLWVNRHWIICCIWAHCGAIKRVFSCFIYMQCFSLMSELSTLEEYCCLYNRYSTKKVI